MDNLDKLTRAQLEKLKVKSEIIHLSKSKWSEPSSWVPISTLIIAIIAAVMTYSSGVFDVKREMIEIETQKLELKKDTLNRQLAELENRYNVKINAYTDLQKKYSSLHDNYINSKDINYRYYLMDNWPASTNQDSIMFIVSAIIGLDKYVLLNGQDIFITYWIIKNGGQTKSSDFEKMENDIKVLRPMKLSMGVIVERLRMLGIIMDYGDKYELKLREPFLLRAMEYNTLYDWRKLKKKMGPIFSQH